MHFNKRKVGNINFSTVQIPRFSQPTYFKVKGEFKDKRRISVLFFISPPAYCNFPESPTTFLFCLFAYQRLKLKITFPSSLVTFH